MPVDHAKPLNILFVTLGYFPSVIGGAERQAQLQAEALVHRGHRVTVICPGQPGLISGDVAGVTVQRLASPKGFKAVRRLAYAIALLLYLLANIRRFDLVHVHALRFEANVIIAVCRLVRRPVFLKIATGGPLGELAMWQRRTWARKLLLLRWATLVQALNSEIVSDLRAMEVSDSRILRIGNGVDLTVFQPATKKEQADKRLLLDLPANDLIALCCGRFQHAKGSQELVTAWESLQLANATLVLVGEFVEPVTFSGDASILIRPWRHEVSHYFQAADVYVSASSAEGMSNSLLEAWASGLGVISTPVGVPASVLTDGSSGLFVPVGDVAQLAAAISKLLQDAPLRQALASRGPGLVQPFAIDAVVDQIEAAYRQMLPR